ncbi:hypothetical protein ACJIZ3_014536 [Penstemon smallii]|uniref:Bifunctional inhibitor/plant lipid transfer protein/seed storage helical domain-containing protein n=1 Tax=Penstemon smallii TaxID=265156 RepID=A0ABD3RK68_9LAMI
MKSVFMVALVVVLVAELHYAAAVTCNPEELNACLWSFVGVLPPTPDCCTKLKEQMTCYCDYIKNPNLGVFLDSPAAKKASRKCGVPTPNCKKVNKE